MAFGGVLLFMGVFSALLFILLGMLVTGVLLLIAAVVFAVLYRRSLSRPAEPERWQRIAGIACAVIGAVLTVTPVLVWMVLIIVSKI